MAQNEQEIGLNIGKGPHKAPQSKASPVKETIPQESLAEVAKNITNPEELIRLIASRPQEDYLPWEKINLPSMGLFYNSRIPGGEIEVRPMGLVTDKILATSRLAQSGQSIDYIYKHCVRFPDQTFDPLDLLTGDRMFLLFYLRGITHGNNYEFTVTCSNEQCKKISNHEFDLNKLAKTIKSPKYQSEPIKIVLPFLTKKTGKEIWVAMRLMRGRDLQIMIRNQKIKSSMMAGQAQSAAEKEGRIEMSPTEVVLDTTIEEHLNLLIESVNGVNDRMLISQFVKKMHASDTATIRETLKDAQPGIDTSIIIKCPECQVEMNLDLPVTESFFRPTESRRTGE